MSEWLGLVLPPSPRDASALALWLTLVLPVLLGALGGLGRPRHAWPVALAGLAPVLASAWLLGEVALHGTLSWAPAIGPLTLHLRVDGLAGLLLVLTQALIVACAAYTAPYLQADAGEKGSGGAWLWPMLGGLASGLSLIWLAVDLLTLYLSLEMMGLTAVGLVLLSGKGEALVAGMRYLLLALMGSLAFLLGVALLLGGWGRLDLAGLATRVEPGPLLWVAMALLSAGLLLKAAAFPLHAWLEPVHAAAWTPVSAVHAALVVKASFFIALQLWLALLPDAAVAAWLIGLLGAAAVVWGGLLAWRADKLKEVIAWSTVAQLGYLLLGFPLLIGTSTAAAQLAWQGVWLQLVAHALAKAGIFLAAGNLILATGETRVAGLAGASRRFPLPLLSFGLAAVGLVGLPPSGGFAAKWLLLNAALEAGQWPWLAVLAAGTLLSAAYVFRVFRYSFVEEAPRHAFRPVPGGMDLIALLLALASLLLGLAAAGPLSLLDAPGAAP